MARHKSPSLSLIFALTVTGVGCGSGAEDPGYDSGIFGMAMPGYDAGPTTGTTAGGTLSGGVTPGGTTSGVVPTLGGTTSGTSSPGGTTSGTSSPGGTTSGTGGGPLVDSGIGGGGTDAGKTDGGVTSPEAGTTGGGTPLNGDCCPDKNCLCHGPVATKLSGSTKGTFKTATLPMSTGTLYYPTDATPPFAGIAICPGFLNSGPEMGDWGPFYASYGIVTLVTDTFPTDFPDTRADLLLGSVAAMKAENMKSGSPLMGKMSDRYGTSGYSMGGGGTVIAASKTPSLKSSVGLAAWGPTGEQQVKVPTLLFCGTDDIVAPCSDHSDPAYTAIPSSTPKMKIIIDGGDHLSAWFAPQDGGAGVSGGWALAFEKVYLEGDTRWKSLLLGKPAGANVTTNIMP